MNLAELKLQIKKLPKQEITQRVRYHAKTRHKVPRYVERTRKGKTFLTVEIMDIWVPLPPIMRILKHYPGDAKVYEYDKGLRIVHNTGYLTIYPYKPEIWEGMLQ